MAKKTTAKKTTSKKTAKKRAPARAAGARNLVIVESPAKAKTIQKYLKPLEAEMGSFEVQASVGHVRDLPPRAPKGVKQPVPGVDLDNRFEPTYEVLSDKKKNITELKRLARQAEIVWFATDLDREGEAISWHLAEVLKENPETARRVVFNAITRDEIARAFSQPRHIDLDRVNAQQARRILDRIVGYQASPLLWKRITSGLSAGRVQSVAVRLVVEREREIQAFVPDESWEVDVRLTTELSGAAALAGAFASVLGERDEKGEGPTQKRIAAWLQDNGGFTATLAELGGVPFKLGTDADEAADLSAEVARVAAAVGLEEPSVSRTEDAKGKGPARFVREVRGRLAADVRYRVTDREQKVVRRKPQPPFITSTLQMAASSFLGFGAKRTMGIAQKLYQNGHITYMRTDSPGLSPEAIAMARDFVQSEFGAAYLPDSPRIWAAASEGAQEAHEAIRPTDASVGAGDLKGVLEEDRKLYDLIRKRYLASQMTDARWNNLTVRFERADRETGAVLRSSGRTLEFDGYLRVTGVPANADNQTLPELDAGAETAAFSIEPKQKFSSPPSRYTEASLIKRLEEEGIGRPSTYASIVSVIQDRKYVELAGKSFRATDLGEVVTDVMIDSFPNLMSLDYTRRMEGELDRIAQKSLDWREMLGEFYGRFSTSLEKAQSQPNVRAELTPARWACPECGSRTAYRMGKSGRFLTCGGYPDCKWACPIDREGNPTGPERVDIVCPEDGGAMELRSGRFGKFIASVNYPAVKFVLNVDRKGGLKLPSPPPLAVDETCEKCGEPCYLRDGKRGPWLGCSAFPRCRGRVGYAKLPEKRRKQLEAELAAHLAANPLPSILRRDGTPVAEGTPVGDILLPGGSVVLEIHADAIEGENAA